jgi:hypothetical protein
MTYDASRRLVVLFGGFVGQSTLLGDTWIWNGSNWTQAHPASSPPAGHYLPMSYDSALGRIVLLDNGQTWLWEGATWSRLPTTHSPTFDAGIVPAMTYDAKSQLLALFGGSSTWVFDGRDWTLKAPATSPSYRGAVAMTYDSAAQRVLLFGGRSIRPGGSQFNDLWSWDGSNWSQIDTGTGPSTRILADFTYDPCAGRDLLFGGTDDARGVDFADTWAWDGQRWSLLEPSASPSTRYAAASAFDGAGFLFVVFGGNHFQTGGGTDLNDTWVWTGHTWIREG